MKTTIIPGTSLRCSRFLFGTGSLFNAGDKKKRYELLKSAVDAGFTHFDTAPYYGFGAAERDLQSILKEHPDVTVTTKVGIYSPGGETQHDALILLRKAAGRVLPSVSSPIKSFNLDRARVALDSSLRRLGRDTIDVYTLHEPNPGDVKTDEWLRWLQDTVKSGKVRHFGLAVTHDRVAPIARECPELCKYIQVFDSIEQKEADVLKDFSLPLQVTYGYVSAARKHGSAASVEAILGAALRRNPDGAVIVSTTKPERTKQYSRILEAVA